MRSERMSRVCIVVLEEVEDDDPSPLHSKATPDHISQNSSQDEKPSLIKAIFNGDADEVRSLIFKKEDVNVQDCEKRTPLHAAAYLGDAEIIELLVLSGARVNAKDNKWLTPLHRAVASCSEEAVQVLLKHSADVNARDKNWQTPLHVAASHKAVRCAEALVPLLSNVNVSDRAGRTALHHAAFSGHLEIKEPNAYGNSALHLACFNGQDVVVSELMEAGADVNQVNEKGFSPLHFTAASRQGALCLELLIANGANINSKVKIHTTSRLLHHNMTALHYAAANCNYQCVFALVGSGASVNERDIRGCGPLHYTAAADSDGNSLRTALHYAAANCNYQCVFALVGSGPSVNERDIRGCGPLHYTAAADSDGKCLEYLLRNDANPALRDKDGYSAVHYTSAYGHRVCLELIANEMPLDVLMDTSASSILHDTDVQPPISPLHLAAYHGHHHALEVLVQSLLDLDVRTPQGHTALSLAAFKGHVECVDILISQGASMMMKDYTHKRSTIHFSAMNGHSECLRLLIHNTEQQTAINIRDGKGQTPLMLAVLGGHTDCVYILLSEGASVEARDKWGRTALHRGAVMGQEACVEALLQHGSSLLVQDSRGRSPMHLAAACGHVGVLRALLKTQKTVLVLKDNCGYTPLHWACYNGHDACVELLLEHDVFQKPEGNSFSPLHCAVINDNESAAEMLIETLGPAIVNATDSQTRTPLHAAAYTDHVECLQLLLGHNAQVNAIDMLGKTALMMAAGNGQTNAVEVLVSSAKADLTLQDAHRNTALHLACSKGHETSALLILEKLTDRNLINCTNTALQTPLHVAAGNGLTVVVQELLGKGASVLAVDENGYTPALACAPNKDVADCLALILSSMMPISPSSTRTMSSLTFTPINHYSSPSKTVTFDPLPVLRSKHVSYHKFNSLGREDGLIIPDDELNDSDSETY
ncbi:serine/threonine-protein phosphatase 6 regulatory ankyrin repeat subunit A-like [Sinocyclocheilus grahami]|uniref:serine/threonine-protein phosphatase 6 regulatory ankyrin repeat subunit A-like n=1 Tax=Sinocyclocheilus grahami TaxID=75366 RepID=UPI0007ACB7F0|nr:PREDICTED: serine/threonine-protein phosphatase 6 regulatory ankyrin repeat subunit A-like [Sinocyclocheilus grahami]